MNAIDKIKSAFNFEVSKFRLSGPENMVTPFYGLFRIGDQFPNGEVIPTNTVKSGYVPHTIDHVIQLVEASQEAFNCQVDVSCTWQDGHIIVVRPTNDYRLKLFGTETVWPRLKISAGYGGSAFSAQLGFFRDACKNLMRFNMVRGSSCSIRHTESFETKHTAIVAQFQRLVNAVQGVETTINRMTETESDIADIMGKLFPIDSETSKREKTNKENEIRSIVSRIVNERQQLGKPRIVDNKVTNWELYNGVQGYVQHTARRQGNPTMLDRALASWDDSRVIRAEELLTV